MDKSEGTAKKASRDEAIVSSLLNLLVTLV